MIRHGSGLVVISAISLLAGGLMIALGIGVYDYLMAPLVANIYISYISVVLLLSGLIMVGIDMCRKNSILRNDP